MMGQLRSTGIPRHRLKRGSCNLHNQSHCHVTLNLSFIYEYIILYSHLCDIHQFTITWLYSVLIATESSTASSTDYRIGIQEAQFVGLGYRIACKLFAMKRNEVEIVNLFKSRIN